jgi:glycine/D-amino acid oxidase-like deaminating enzyme
VPRSEQRRDIASDIYHGGAVIPDLGSLHPGLYHKGLLERVIEAGGLVYARRAVDAIEPVSGERRFRLRTGAGDFSARDVIVATNGYTPRRFRWHARRLVPFSGYMAATEQIAPSTLSRLVPKGRTVIDSNTNINYIRPAPDSPRLLFGGLTGSRPPSLRAMAVRLRGVLGQVLPEAADVKLSRVWTGQCAGTFDFLPHIGSADGIWYAMGYNFAGVPMGTYLGTKLAHKIVGSPEGKTVFDGKRFPTVPLYHGTPWFVPMAMRYFDWQDRRFARKGTGRRL